MTKTLENFYDDLGARESGGDYTIINKWGYVGKYQMGESAMIDAGYYKKPSGNYNNDWTGHFTGKDGIYSLDDFKNNKQAQENAQKAFKQAQWQQLKSIGADKYVGEEINGIKITQSGLLAAAHLKGPGNVKKYLESNGVNNPKDGLGTSVESYMKKFEGYDVSSITGIKENTDNIDNELKKETPKIFTREEIAKMTPKEFEQNEQAIMEQMKNGQIKSEANIIDYENYKNPQSGKSRVFTREDIQKMTTDEYSKYEKEINSQIKTIGLPYEKDLPKKTLTYKKEKSKNYSSASKDGKWVTINGNHVLID